MQCTYFKLKIEIINCRIQNIQITRETVGVGMSAYVFIKSVGDGDESQSETSVGITNACECFAEKKNQKKMADRALRESY